MLLGAVTKIKNGPLLRYRLENGINQRQAAELIGVQPWVWGKLENLKFKGIGLKTVSKVADALGITIEELYPEELRNLNLSLERVELKEINTKHLLANKAKEQLKLPSPEQRLEAKELKSIVLEALDMLPLKERVVLKLRFGIGDTKPHTLEQVGKELGLTRETVRQIQAKGIRKLQETERCRKLVPFVIEEDE